MRGNYYERRPEIVAAVKHEGEVGPTLRSLLALSIFRGVSVIKDGDHPGWIRLGGDGDGQSVRLGEYIVANIKGEITVLPADEFNLLYSAI